jgi:hypothetical protein
MKKILWLLPVILLCSCAGTYPSADKEITTKIFINIEDNDEAVHVYMSPDLGFKVDAGQAVESISEQTQDTKIEPSSAGKAAGSLLGAAAKTVVK